ncbi:MAG: AAA family ATPase [Eubacteriales bacterium]|nr:AAA family ATPase [Eubacteriales bacterium]
MVVQGQIYYDSFDNKVEVKKVLDSNTFLAIVYSVTKCTFNGTTTETVRPEEREYSTKDIGIRIFYNKGDYSKGRKLVEEKEYKWNIESITEYHDACDDKERAHIISYAPSEDILTERDREKLIRSYNNKELQDKTENEFRKKYAGKYFGRMDFDIEYFSNRRPDLWKEHYYNKIYVGKHGAVSDENNKLVITDWRSPIGGFFSDNENRFYDPEVDKSLAYNYELIMKRKFSDDCSRYATVFIADGEMYKDGDMDPFLIEVLTRLRRSGNDKAVDIIETIQAGQNAIVREKLNTSFYVQGCAGSGKTMILLHRLSCLLYNNKYLDTSKIKIITPNENIINQLRELSAELEISNIQQMTLEKYYIYLISEYSRSLIETMQRDSLDIKNETLLSPDFLEYIYSDSCVAALNESYTKYFDDIMNETSKYISVDNTYDLLTLHDYAKNLYNLYSKMNQSRLEKQSKEKIKSEIEKSLSNLIKEYDDQIKSNKTLLKLEKKINDLNKEKSLIESLSDNIKVINRQKRQLEEYSIDKEKGESFLKEFYHINEDNFIETILFRSITEILDIDAKNKDTENIIKNTIKRNKEEKDRLLEKVESANSEIEQLQEQYSKTSKFNIFKRSKISSLIKRMKIENEDIEYKISTIQKSIERKQNELISVSVEFNNIRYNAKKFIENKLDEYVSLSSSLLAQIKANEKKVNLTLEKYKVTLENVDVRLVEIESEIKENEALLLSENEGLMSLKNNIDNVKETIRKAEEEIISIYPYTENEEKSILKLCNRLLHKNEDGKFDGQLKFTDYRFVFDILEPLITDIYSKFNIKKDNSLYKHNFYLILYILIRMYGEKSVNTMVNIDEAQDITINEYEVIRKANKDSIFNLYGDTNQLLYKNRGIEKWDQLSNFNLKGFKLNINYRNISQITYYCNKELSPLSMEPMGVDGDEVKEISIAEISDYIDNATYVIVKDRNTLAQLPIKNYNFIEKKDEDISPDNINVMTVEMVKGMEFSNVIVVDSGMNRREKYVAYTRALNKLVVAR